MDIEATPLLAVYGAFVIGLVSPGPDFVLITALALSRGASAALNAAAGIALGVALWVLAAASGLGIIIENAPLTWDGLRYAGGGALIYMGSRALSAAIRPSQTTEAETRPEKDASPLLMGLLTNLANPKAAVVLVGLTALMADSISNTATLSVLVLGMPALTWLWFSLLATVLAKPVVRDRLLSYQRALDVWVGVALIGIGILLIQAVGAV